MKALFLKALELLNPTEVPTDPAELAIYNQLKLIRFSDLDKGQLESNTDRPAVAFPCVLIGIELPNTVDIGNDKQKCQARINLRIAFDYTGRTGSNVPTPVQEQSLAYFDLIDAIYKTFQGYFGSGFTRFSRVSLREERRNDGLKVLTMPIATTFIDQ